MAHDVLELVVALARRGKPLWFDWGSTEPGGCIPARVTGCTGPPWLAASRLGYLTRWVGRVPLAAALGSCDVVSPAALERNR